MPSQSWVALTPNLPVADGATLTNSAALTAVSPTPDITVPANFLNAGSRLRVTARGRWTQATATNLTLALYWGGTGGTLITGSSTGALALAAGTNLTWEYRCDLSIRTAGASGTVMGTGHLLGITSAAGVNLIPSSAPAVTTINTTTANALVMGATASVATSWNMTVHEWIIESLA